MRIGRTAELFTRHRFSRRAGDLSEMSIAMQFIRLALEINATTKYASRSITLSARWLDALIAESPMKAAGHERDALLFTFLSYNRGAHKTGRSCNAKC